jgi:uncharacterized protein (DUF4415 family)
MARQKPDPAEMPDEENPEWTDETFARARPAAEVLPRYIGQAATDELLRRGPGRPAKADRKVNQTIRLDADVLAAYREQGKGWQTLMNEVLRRHMPARR